MMRPLDIVAAATARIAHAPAVLGPMEIAGLTELAVLAAAAPGPHRPYPRAVDRRPEERSRMAGRHGRHDRARTGASAGVSAVSAATAYHEAIEAMRWARGLLASGVCPRRSPSRPPRPPTMTIISWPCAPTPTSTCTSSTASAPSPPARARRRGAGRHRRPRPVAVAVAAPRGALPGQRAFRTLPEGWLRVLPTDAPLDAGAWNRLLPVGAGRLARWRRPYPALRAAIETLAKDQRPPARSEKPSSRAARSRSGARRCSPAPPPRSTRRWRP
jgi:hypothetical protein